MGASFFLFPCKPPAQAGCPGSRTPFPLQSLRGLPRALTQRLLLLPLPPGSLSSEHLAHLPSLCLTQPFLLSQGPTVGGALLLSVGVS